MADLSHLEIENKRLKTAVGELEALIDIATAISSSLSVEEICDRIVGKVIKRCRGSQGAIFLLGKSEKAPMETFVRRKDSGVREHPARMGMALTGWMIKNQRALILSTDKDPDGLLAHSTEGVKSALTVPLKTQGKLIGVMTVFNKLDSDSFTMDDQRFLSIVAAQSAQSLEAARLQQEEKRLGQLKEEMRVAGQIQGTMMPSEFPSMSGYDLYATNMPADEIGGDCYDVIQIDSHRTLISVGDVSGHGVGAALLMANAQAVVRAQLPYSETAEPDLREIVQGVSEFLSQWTEHDKYITLFLGILDSADGTIEFVNAGHNPPMLLEGDGKLTELEAGGIPLGMFTGSFYDVGKITLDINSRLLVFTDGVTELANEADEQFGEERLGSFIQNSQKLDSRSFCDKLMDELGSYRGKSVQADDITLLSIRRV